MSRTAVVLNIKHISADISEENAFLLLLYCNKYSINI